VIPLSGAYYIRRVNFAKKVSKKTKKVIKLFQEKQKPNFSEKLRRLWKKILSLKVLLNKLRSKPD